jgi:hypothetical protein
VDEGIRWLRAKVGLKLGVHVMGLSVLSRLYLFEEVIQNGYTYPTCRPAPPKLTITRQVDGSRELRHLHVALASHHTEGVGAEVRLATDGK